MINDIAIGILGLGTLWLFQCKKTKLASLVGLLAQPFWLYTTYQAHQWGIFFICILYTAMYVKGALSDRELD